MKQTPPYIIVRDCHFFSTEYAKVHNRQHLFSVYAEIIRRPCYNQKKLFKFHNRGM